MERKIYKFENVENNSYLSSAKVYILSQNLLLKQNKTF